MFLPKSFILFGRFIKRFPSAQSIVVSGKMRLSGVTPVIETVEFSPPPSDCKDGFTAHLRVL